jgi:hypothetical protein
MDPSRVNWTLVFRGKNGPVGRTYKPEESGFEFLEQLTPVQALYPTTMVAEDILWNYVREGLEKDHARMKAKGPESV